MGGEVPPRHNLHERDEEERKQTGRAGKENGEGDGPPPDKPPPGHGDRPGDTLAPDKKSRPFGQLPLTVYKAWILYLADDSLLCPTHEVYYAADFGRIGHLLVYLDAGIKHGGLAMEQQPVGIGNVLLYLRLDPGRIADSRIHAMVLYRTSARNDIRRNVLGEGRTGLYHRILSHTGVRLLDDVRGDDRTRTDPAVSCDLSTIAEDAMVADNSVVADMRSLHQEIV